MPKPQRLLEAFDKAEAGCIRASGPAQAQMPPARGTVTPSPEAASRTRLPTSTRVPLH